ncbi:serine hydrolase [Microbacterium gorillae]|uniref:serine hydrolase n=1 Tax=Microbacterium gorillae TaxID=1231063 RepID=UPI0006937B4C|nr:serine hydrolase [Microbacterium gorillae]
MRHVQKRSAARRAATTVTATAAVVVMGMLSGCTTGGTGTTAAPLAVEAGAAPNQDVLPLYTDRADAIAAALKKLPGQVKDAMQRSGVPGASVAVVSDGKTVYQGAFGVRDTRTGELVDKDTLFQIASLSKPISATVVAKAITESKGALSWSTKVSSLLPGFRLSDPYVTANATIGDFFAHRTGIPTGGGDDLEDLGFDRTYILGHLAQIPLQPFRTTYQYSNFGLTTGAVAAAESRGQSWEEMAKELLFEPLGMTSTTSSHADFAATTDRAIEHARIGEKSFQPLFDRDPDAEAPAGGMASTSGDVAKWMALVLADGKLNGAQFIDPEPLTEAFSSQIVTSHNTTFDQRPTHYGFGINVNAAAGGRVTLSHSGAFGLGTATAAILVPDLGIGITVLTNGAPIGMPEAVTQEFIDQVMYGAQTRDWVDAFHGRFESFNAPSGDLAGQTAPAHAAASGPLSDYVGTYRGDYLGTLTVTERNGTLEGAMGPNGGYTFAIEPWSGDTKAFAPVGENALPGSLSSAVFSRTNGAVTGVTLTFFNSFPQVPEPTGLGVLTRTG